MTDSTERSPLISKIEALFRKANDPAATGPEREAFLTKAQQLMLKHQIDEIVLNTGGREVPQDLYYGLLTGTYARPLGSIVYAVARAHSVEAYGYTSGVAGKPDRRTYLFGYPSDTARVKQLAQLFIQDAQQQASLQTGSSPNDTIRRRRSFLFGYAEAIVARYRKAMRDLEDQTPGTGLVLVGRSTEVRSAMQQQHPDIRTERTKSRIDQDARNAGFRAGQSSNIGRDSVRATPALGAGS